MNHDVEYRNHKNHLANLRQEAKGERLIQSDASSVQKKVVFHTVVMEKLLAWISQLKKRKTSMTPKPTLKQN